MKRIAAIVAGALILAASTYGVRTLAASPARARVNPVIDLGSPGISDRSELERLISAYEEQVHGHPNSTAFTFLAKLYLQRARLTGDLGTYEQARAAVARSLRMSPKDTEARTLLATLQYTTHDFAAALRTASSIVAGDQTALGASAIIADAQMELGDYGHATGIIATLHAKAPHSSAVEVRQARLSFLRGDTATARSLAAAATRDAKAEGAFGASLAFFHTFEGQLAFDAGRYADAADAYRIALSLAPDWIVAEYGLARAEASLGDLGAAVSSYERLVAQQPQPDALGALGDLYRAMGRTALASREYDTVQFIGTLARINRQVFNRQLVLFDADHGVHVSEALALAENELRVRRDVYGYDAYSWILYRAGRYADAAAASQRALALGTNDARLWYHAGMIAIANGDRSTGTTWLRRALALSPSFDLLQAKRAREALS